MLAWSIEHQAGIPVLMTPRRGNRSDAPAFGPIGREPMAQGHPTDGPTSVVAEAALYSEDHLQALAKTQLTWSPRVPATWHEAPSARAQAEPATLRAMTAGDRAHVSPSTAGGVEPRGGLISSEPRQPQAKRTVDTQRRTQSDQEVQAVKALGGATCAGAAEARQALVPLEHGLQATCRDKRTSCPAPRYGKRGRPRQGAPPNHGVSSLAGALASQFAARQARIERQRCCTLATHALDTTQLPAQERLEGDKGQGHAEGGLRFRKAPGLLAASLALQKPERIMALLRGRPVCLLVYAALE